MLIMICHVKAPGINLNKGDFSSSYESYVRNSKNNLDSPVSKVSFDNMTTLVFESQCYAE